MLLSTKITKKKTRNNFWSYFQNVVFDIKVNWFDTLVLTYSSGLNNSFIGMDGQTLKPEIVGYLRTRWGDNYRQKSVWGVVDCIYVNKDDQPIWSISIIFNI